MKEYYSSTLQLNPFDHESKSNGLMKSENLAWETMICDNRVYIAHLYGRGKAEDGVKVFISKPQILALDS
jgi:hypothetical protein